MQRLVLTVSLLFLVGCGSSSSNPTNDNDVPVNDNTQNTTNNFTPSPYLQKLGDDGVLLNDNAETWKIVEFIDESIMVEGKTLSSYVKKFSFERAKEYCDNLDYAGYVDWKIPNSEELRYILTIAANSDVEKSYFPYYFNDSSYSIGRTWYTSLIVSSIDDENLSAGSLSVVKEDWSTTAYIDSHSDIATEESPRKVMCIRK